MIVKNINLENFRGFKKAEIQFNEKLNVFIGNNGAGKTSVLEAVVMCLQEMLLEFANDSKSFSLINRDVNFNTNFCNVGTEIILYTDYTIQYSCSLSYPKKNSRYNEPLEYRESIAKYFFYTNVQIPIIKFYGASRNSTQYNQYQNDNIYPRPQLEVWDNIHHDNLSYSKFLTWFFDYETKELRHKRDVGDLNAELPVLKAVRTAISKAFQKLQNKELLIQSDQIKREGTNELIPSLVLQEKGSDKKLDISSLSDGEKSIITLVADIAYNLSISNPEGKSVEEILSSKGIVLIDEIDAHLHPTWQREILPLLLSLFPDIQFFVTTHSPQIISSVSSEHVFICDNFEISQLHFKTKGLDSNTILKHIFKTTDRPKEYQNLIQEFDLLMDSNGSVEELYKILKKIEQKEKEDTNLDTSQLMNELEIRLEAYKFDLEHEKNQ